MPEHASILQLVGVATLAVSAVIWVAVLVRVLRRDMPAHRARLARSARRRTGTLRGLPRQRSSAPSAENVELTAAEREAFVDLIRRLGDSRSQTGGPSGELGLGETGRP
ncbi:hypothetical protein GCM10010145_02780 [Streptomyces ruber]|uniref:Uncharacterized protein n=2 Tax=Streptomyces TaxID=1883 RepID=A0A918EPV5_9ACTN|nr:hypothetical protein [Streptomyces ruber]GGQ38825.1 hypothetical protein GCM10010145_02780 [Streptomyces ruber]